jgi:hypothetical protein
MPAITETNSGPDPIDARLAYIAIGEYGAPIFAPWALNISYPTPFRPYVLGDGSIAHGGPGLHECYHSIGQALAQVSTYAGTDKLKVFMSRVPGESFSIIGDVNGAKVTVTGQDNGQAIVIHAEPDEFTIVGYRCRVAIATEKARWPDLKQIRVERGRYEGDVWQQEGVCWYVIDQSAGIIGLGMDTPQVHRVWC